MYSKGSVNKVILLGRLGRDPEVKHINNNQVANFSIATEMAWKDKDGTQQSKTEWHRIVGWQHWAELAANYLKKGSLVYIEGHLQTRSWEKDGVTHYVTEIVIDTMTMIGGKSQVTDSIPPPAAQTTAPGSVRNNTEPESQPPQEDDLPF